MHGHCLVAVYPSRDEAEQAFRAARGSGIPSHNIRMSGADMEQPNAWDWLFSGHVPEREKTYYRTHLAKGRAALSILIDDTAPPARIEAVEEILDRYHPVEVRIEEEEEGSAAGGKAQKAGGPSARAAPKKAAGAKEEEIIPLPREEAKVGTRATDRVRHIRTFVVEEPFEKEVSLSDERLVVERRAATASEEGGEISERDYEFHERHEEPVVEMTTRTDEELAVRREPSQHTERVRGKARRTEVEFEAEEAETAQEASAQGEASAPSPAKTKTPSPGSRAPAPHAPGAHAPASMKGRS